MRYTRRSSGTLLRGRDDDIAGLCFSRVLRRESRSRQRRYIIENKLAMYRVQEGFKRGIFV